MNMAAYPTYDSYRDSGIAWLPKLPSHWLRYRSKFVFQQSKELARKTDVQLSSTQSYGVIPQADYEEIIGRKVTQAQVNLEKRKHVEIDDFVISMRSFQGGLERSKAVGCIRSSYVILKPGCMVWPDYYAYFLKTPRYIQALQLTGNFIRDGQDLNFENFSDVDLFVPPLPEQRAIAAFLDAKCAKIDRAIEIKEAQIKLLAERRQILIQQAVTRGIDPDVPMKDSEVDWIGQIPAHWEVKRLRHAAAISPSRRVDGNTGRQDQVVFLPMDAIGTNGQVQQTDTYAAKNVCDGFTYFRRGDVVIAKITPCFENGKGAFLSDLVTDYGFGTTELHVLRPKQLTGNFLYYFVSQRVFRVIGEVFMVGSAGQKRVSTDYLKNHAITVPPISEQLEVTRYLEEKSARIEQAISIKESQITALKEYKTTLINEAVTGKIKVC